MTVRQILFFALMSMSVAGCGDPQLNESRREFFLVSLDEWHTRYAPGITAVVPFPQLAEVSDPRFTSSDTSVAQVSVFRQDIDEPRFRALKVTTGIRGDADIDLYDGNRLVHAESIRVEEPTHYEFDFTIHNHFAPHEAALGPDERVDYLAESVVPAVLRFYDDDVEVVAAGVLSAQPQQLFFSGVLLRKIGELVDAPIILGESLFRSLEHLNSGDIFEVTAVGRPGLEIDIPGGRSVGNGTASRYGEIGEAVDWGSVDALEIVASPERVGNRASIAVFGLLSDGIRVVGLDPTVTLDGAALDHCARDECSDERSLYLADWRWLFPLPEDATTGTIEVQWRGLTATVALGATE